jgi:cytokinin riboside 5'-monophosphate phosphoribohydrolase
MEKNLCVYCASGLELDAKHYALGDTLGRELARRGWGLVYGGGRAGVMGSVAQATTAAGGRVLGVIPDFMVERELAYREADELIVVASMRERRRIMEERASAFVALPGGFGTLEEMIEILVGRMLNRHTKPLVLLNADGFYDGLIAFFDQLVRERFKKSGWRELMPVATNLDELWPLLERELTRASAGVDPLWR